MVERYAVISLSSVVDAEALDGPFVGAGGRFGLLVSLRSGAIASPREVHWTRDVPGVMRGVDVDVFVRNDDNTVVFMGVVRFAKTGNRKPDGVRAAFAFTDPIDEAQWRRLETAAHAAPPPFPEEAVAALTATSTTDEHLAAARSFVERWYGPLPISGATSALNVLEEFSRAHRVTHQNQLVWPTREEDGRLVFYEENQGVCRWATDGDAVFVRQSEYGAPWKQESGSLSAFVVQLLVYEATFKAPFGAQADGASPRLLTRLARHAPRLRLKRWQDSKTEFFAGNGIVGWAQNGMVWVGAQHAIHFAPVEDLFST